MITVNQVLTSLIMNHRRDATRIYESDMTPESKISALSNINQLVEWTLRDHEIEPKTRYVIDALNWNESELSYIKTPYASIESKVKLFYKMFDLVDIHRL